MYADESFDTGTCGLTSSVLAVASGACGDGIERGGSPSPFRRPRRWSDAVAALDDDDERTPAAGAGRLDGGDSDVLVLHLANPSLVGGFACVVWGLNDIGPILRFATT
jgi:hypothetical protein